MTAAVGQHWLIELSQADPARLASPAQIEHALRAAAEAAGAHVVHAHFHHFGPNQGVTGMLLLRESHISIHSWPELAYAAVDLFMCGHAAPDRALAVLQAQLQAAACQVRQLQRGPQAVEP